MADINEYEDWKFFVPMMDKELGPAFEQGLLNIKEVLENSINKDQNSF